ncbi:MAG: exonuclease SbcCD subunit D C-terminal domain-containing protein [Hyphomonas sp.]|uniref:exonuclease SbcCD subunit D n=1 Tax=Hyphomonas sp. TaxID=87 RepID=UPI003003246D
MKLLHTSDLHLGRQFNGTSLEEDHAVALDQIVEAVKANSVDALIIAGDVFDRASPPQGAVRQFNGFLQRVKTETDAAVAMIAGNHDSGDRIDLSAIAADRSRWLIRGAISSEEAPLLLSDQHGTVAISALPFAYEYAARECFESESIDTPEDVLVAQVAAARAQIPESTRWVIVAHAFVTGGSVSDSERSLTRVGGIETVRTSAFDGAHYVALGHLHRPQSVGAEHIRYSGSPLAFGFDEADSEKSMSLIELDAAGQASVEVLPFKPVRRARVLRGKHAELLLSDPSGDFIKAVLTDDAPVIDGMKRLREVFPNACELVYSRDGRPLEVKSADGQSVAAAEPVDVVRSFLTEVSLEAITDSEQEVVAASLTRLRQKEDAE